MLKLTMTLWGAALLLISAHSDAHEHARLPDLKVLAEVSLPFRTQDEFSKHLRNLRDHFLERGDARAVFADAYVITEKNLRNAMEANRFRNTTWMQRLTLAFANLYREALLTEELMASTQAFLPYSWQVAFTEARDGHKGVIRHLILGMNAHIDRDLPFALESASKGTPLLKRVFSRFLDFNRAGRIIVGEIGEIEDQLIEHFPDEIYGLTHLQNRVAKTLLGLGILGIRQRAWDLGMSLCLAPESRSRELISRSIEFRANFYANRLRNVPYLQIESQVPEPLPYP